MADLDKLFAKPKHERCMLGLTDEKTKTRIVEALKALDKDLIEAAMTVSLTFYAKLDVRTAKVDGLLFCPCCVKAVKEQLTSSIHALDFILDQVEKDKDE